MSRTFVHRPLDSMLDLPIDDWKEEYSKHSNTREHNTKRWSRRKVRHAMIDDDEVSLYNAMAERGRNSHTARNMYW